MVHDEGMLTELADCLLEGYCTKLKNMSGFVQFFHSWDFGSKTLYIDGAN